MNRRDPSGNDDLIEETVALEISGELAAMEVAPTTTANVLALADTEAAANADWAAFEAAMVAAAVAFEPLVLTAADQTVGLLYQLESLFVLSELAELEEFAGLLTGPVKNVSGEILMLFIEF